MAAAKAQALESASGEGLHTVIVLVGLPQNDILQALLAQRDAQLVTLEARVQALERGGQADLWPSIGLALLVGAMLGAGRRRREQGAQRGAQANDRSGQDVTHSWL